MANTAPAEATQLRFFSPNHKIQVTFWLAPNGSGQGLPCYNVLFNDHIIVGDSPLGLALKDQAPLQDFVIRAMTQSSHNSSYELPLGKASRLHNYFNETIFTLEENSPRKRQLEIVFRVYNDGIGFRYSLPAQSAIKEFTITQELTAINLQNDPTLYAVELPFNSSFEGYYSVKKLSHFAVESTMTLPVLVGEGKGPWLALTEAGLEDFAGLYVARGASGWLEARLAPSQQDPRVKVVAQTPFVSPWRVLMIANTPNELLESNLVMNLNESTQIADTSWIHPGKIHFPWFSDYHLPAIPGDTDPAHQPGLNTFSLKRFIDFCAAHGIEAHSLDGFDQAWYGGAIGNPPPDADVTKAIPQIDLPEVLRYARAQGVKTRLWMHRKALEGRNLERIFALYEEWGIEGIMVDFMNSDDQQSVRLASEIVRRAAAHHLTVNFHGAWKPTGLSRTYPNLLSHEGVLSTEYNRFIAADDSENGLHNGRVIGSTPEHEMNYVWVRQLAGAMDVHPGSVNPVLPQNFNPATDGLRAMGTLARELAMYIVVESGAQMAGDSPANYLAAPEALDFISKVPVSWDETRVIGGQVGKSISVARRKGRNWYVGSMTDRRPRHIELPLAFLGPGKFTAEIYSDGPESSTRANDLRVTKTAVSAKGTLRLNLAGSGGNAIRITDH